MNNITTNVSANNQVVLARQLIVNASMQRREHIYRAQLESVVDPDNKRIWQEIVKEANYWGVEIAD